MNQFDFVFDSILKLGDEKTQTVTVCKKPEWVTEEMEQDALEVKSE